MNFAEHTFHNSYLLQEIFSHAGNKQRYCNLHNGDKVAQKSLLKLLQLKAEFENDLQFTTRKIYRGNWGGNWEPMIGLRIAMNYAAACGNLPVVQWLHENRTEGCTTDAMDWAAQYGHLPVVKFLHVNRSEGCTASAMNGAAGNNHLEIVKWLHENRTEGCTTSAMDWAAENGYPHVVRWLCENRKECNNINVLRKCAAKHDYRIAIELLPITE